MEVPALETPLRKSTRNGNSLCATQPPSNEIRTEQE